MILNLWLTHEHAAYLRADEVEALHRTRVSKQKFHTSKPIDRRFSSCEKKLKM